MKQLVFFLLILISTIGFGQNNYKINKHTWSYSKPSDYIVRIDNFEKTRETGENYLKENPDVKLDNDEVVLFSLAKSDSIQINIIQASYSNNDNIKKLTPKVYSEQLADFFRQNPKETNPKNLVSVKVDEVYINDFKFFAIEKNVDYTEHDYLFTSIYYFTEIDNKEFTIVALFDNEKDRKKIINSILNSTLK